MSVSTPLCISAHLFIVNNTDCAYRLHSIKMSARRNFFAKQVDEFKRERELLYEQMEELEATQTAEEIQDRVSKAEIKVVEADIKLVEADIELVEAEIVTLRAAPNSEEPEIQIQILNKQIELVELQIRSTTDPVEKNQLREKERQLRAEKNTLLTGALGEGTTNTTAEALATIQQDLATLKRQHASSIRISHASTQTATALAQSIGVSATVHSTGITARYEHPLELQHLFDWGPYTHHKPVTGGVKYDEDLASSALRNFLITVLKDNSLYGRSFFEVYDVRRFQNLLTQEFSDQKFKGTTDAIVAPHGLIAEGSLSQARYVVDWKTPQTMAQLQKSLAARFDPSGHKLKKEERITCGMPFVEFFCSAAKSQTLFEVVFTDMCTSALILSLIHISEPTRPY
eukprot:TRINITY_DN404_c0_g1_i12.p1 TRINITY_DN404_c0_g1~~TRINITY_DN404_c0_g1_i12.p1  ORF type:complete len:401 (-),score=81.90 TRINITY_DN404_c0_g1_i12:131-1333(-)